MKFLDTLPSLICKPFRKTLKRTNVVTHKYKERSKLDGFNFFN